MGKIVYFNNNNYMYYTKGDKMCNRVVMSIRKEKKNIEDMPFRAQEILKYFRINDFSNGVPIVEILNKLGFKAYQSDLEPNGLSAYIAVDPKFEDVFGTNKITCVHIENSIGHKRFAMAHELAHYLFDFDEKNDLYYYNTYFPSKDNADNEEEKRANAFAANLLMPEEIFRSKFKEYEKLQSKADIVSYLARFFLVSSSAVLKRFEELGINGYERISNG